MSTHNCDYLGCDVENDIHASNDFVPLERERRARALTRPTDPTLADVDGTTPARAALLCIRLDPYDPEQMHTIFVEGEGECTDPWASAERLQSSLASDWPEHVWTIVGNERARFLRWKDGMDQLLGGPNTPQEYLDAITSPARQHQHPTLPR